MNTSKIFSVKRGIIAPIILVIALLAGVGVAALYFQSRSNPATQLPSPSPSPQLTQTTPTDETANWKIYKSLAEGYEIKYPANWYLSEPSCEEKCAVSISDSDLSVFEKVPKPDDKSHVRISILVFKQNDPDLVQFKKVSVKGENSISLANTSGVKRTEVRNDFLQLGENVLTESIYLNYNGKTYIIYYFPADFVHLDKLGQILSTFKFL